MRKRLLIVGGPNGAGKTTFVRQFLTENRDEYLGADQIAAELNPDRPESVAFEAGRLFLQRLIDRIDRGQSAIIESTLAGRSLVRHVEKASDLGFETAVNFVFLDSPETCVARVAQRVRMGGHHVPEDDVRRRYSRCLRYFWHVYRPVVDRWQLHFNRGGDYLAVAAGSGTIFQVEHSQAMNTFLAIAEA
ncbi:MAG: AAA family ATPase [Planctomycetota bacterium]